jgi:hypothetical protein
MTAQTLHVPGYDNLQSVYARGGTRDEIQAALAGLGEPRAVNWNPTVKARPVARIAPKFMARTVADAADSLRNLQAYKATGDGRKIAPEIRRGDKWLAARGWAYRAESRELRCLTCRRSYSASKAETDSCSRAAETDSCSRAA